MTKEERYAQLRKETIGNVTVLTGPAGCGKSSYAHQEVAEIKGSVVSILAWHLEYDGQQGRINPDCVRLLAARNVAAIIEECSPEQIGFLQRHCARYAPCQFFLIQKA